jgi:hypothetical protein
MDWTIIGTLSSIILATASLVLSVYTYVKTERRQHQQELRQFLVEASQCSKQLSLAVYDFVRQGNPETVESKVMPVMMELSRFSARALQWHDEPFYSAFEEMERAIRAFAEAFEKTTQDKLQGEVIVDATKRLFEKSQNFTSTALKTLGDL